MREGLKRWPGGKLEKKLPGEMIKIYDL